MANSDAKDAPLSVCEERSERDHNTIGKAFVEASHGPVTKSYIDSVGREMLDSTLARLRAIQASRKSHGEAPS